MPTENDIVSLASVSIDNIWEDSETPNYKELYRRIELIASARKNLKILEEELEKRCNNAMTDKIMPLDNGRELERTITSSRKSWQHEDLIAEIKRYAVRSGENPFETLVRCARQEWRIRPLRAIEIDPDEYSENIPGRLTVAIRFGPNSLTDNKDVEEPF